MSQMSCESNKALKKLSLNSMLVLGDIKKVKMLIKKGADINKPGKKSWTPLHVAAKHGHHEIVQLLIQKGASVDSEITEPKGRGFTPLHLAVLKNHIGCAKLLIENNASVVPKSEEVFHPIQIAVFKNHVEMAVLLLNHGAHVNARYNNYFFKVFKHTMLENLWIDHNLPLLQCSILLKFNDMTNLLLERGADINLKTSLGKTTLMQAVEVNNPELVKLLLARGANPNDRDIFGEPVLHFTIINANRRRSMYNKEEKGYHAEKLEILKLLVDSGANANARFPVEKDHASVIHYMIICGFRSGVEYLIQKNYCDPGEIDLRALFSGQLNRKYFTPDIIDDVDYISDLEDDFESITYSIMQWAMARNMVGLPVNKAIILNHPIHRGIPQEEFIKEMESFRQRITEQVNFMHQTKIGDGNVTFCQLLHSSRDELIKILSNKRINYFHALETSKWKLINYFDLLKAKMIAAEHRKVLLSKSIEVMFNFFQRRLPYDCCQLIVRYLNDKELEASLVI